MINEYLLFPVPFPSLSDIQNKLKGPFSIYRTKRVQLHDAAYWSHGQRNALHLLTPLLSQGFVYKVMSGQKDFTKKKTKKTTTTTTRKQIWKHSNLLFVKLSRVPAMQDPPNYDNCTCYVSHQFCPSIWTKPRYTLFSHWLITHFDPRDILSLIASMKYKPDQGLF